MFNFGNLNRVVFHTVDTLKTLAHDIEAQQDVDLQSITEELLETNQALDETIGESQVSDAALRALKGLRIDLREEVIRSLSKQLLSQIPLLQVQAGTAQAQQNQFSKELKKFEDRLQYVLKMLKKSRGGQAAEVEQDTTE